MDDVQIHCDCGDEPGDEQSEDLWEKNVRSLAQSALLVTPGSATHVVACAHECLNASCG